MYVIDPSVIGSVNGLSLGRRQVIIWTNAKILWIGPLGINFSEILVEIYIFSFKKMHLKISGNRGPVCLGLNVLICMVLGAEYSRRSRQMPCRAVHIITNFTYARQVRKEKWYNDSYIFIFSQNNSACQELTHRRIRHLDPCGKTVIWKNLCHSEQIVWERHSDLLVILSKDNQLTKLTKSRPEQLYTACGITELCKVSSYKTVT